MNKKQFFKIFSLLSNLKILLAITLIITSSFKDSAVVKIIYPTTNFYRNNSEKRITKKSTQNSVEKTVRKFTIEKDITLPTFKIEMRDIEDFIKRNFLQRKYKKIILKFSLNDFAD